LHEARRIESEQMAIILKQNNLYRSLFVDQTSMIALTSVLIAINSVESESFDEKLSNENLLDQCEDLRLQLDQRVSVRIYIFSPSLPSFYFTGNFKAKR
jgi:hypothetical protein